MREEAERVLESWIHGLQELDAELLSNLFALDEDLVNWGIGKNERYMGWEDYRIHIEHAAQVLQKNEISVTEQQVRLSRSRDVAWFNQVRDYRGTLSNGDVVRIEGVRVTGVLEKREDRWVIVHFHHALPSQVALPDPEEGDRT